MKLIREFAACLLVGLVLVFATATAHAKKPENPGGGHGGGQGGGAVPLLVTFRDGAGDNFLSDGVSGYTDGIDSVNTQIDKFRFGLNVGMSGVPRNFVLDLADCTVPPECVPIDLHSSGWNVFSTHPDGAQFLKMSANGPIPGDDDSKFVNFQLDFFDGAGQQWRIQFNPSECPMDSSGVNLADMATVTKTSDNPDTWVFEAFPGDVACLQLRMGGRKHFTFHGLYYVPFQITALALEQP